MAAPVAMAAETPQMEMPDASGAAHSRLNLKYRPGDVIDHAPVEEIGFNNGAQSPENDVPGETGGVGGPSRRVPRP